jgi:hypothetical protein
MSKIRLASVALAVAGAALLQGCAVVTGPYVAERAPLTSHSMVTRFDKRFLSADGSATTSRSTLYMPRSQPRGGFYFMY